MKKTQAIAIALSTFALMALAGCSKSDQAASATVASPTCADLPNLSDPAQRAELQKKCPRSGAAFQPSPAKSY
ncbi:entry exclusion lipoprotein TrbK [Burkholderia gladioli]|uniref:entry exclusion lipoprotein TrbK n=1 Tax=Burkholderia gladioli TaxID=28095 RepID=UPI00285A254F|nr:entry exclusion lipoprotein TrbK [Burkholderia gladioli]MDR8093090.1 entry exclusion lipoprotein TrbK [Burkholderia gladioli]